MSDRNNKHHSKYFAMLHLAFDYWQPEVFYKGIRVEKNFDRFRHDLQILAGHYDVTVNIEGELRLEPKSISFKNMTQKEFESMYNNVMNIILDKIMPDVKKDEFEKAVNSYEGTY